MASSQAGELLDGTDGRDDFTRLQLFLREADIFDFFNGIYYRLGIHRVKDLADITQEDAEGIRMTPPQFQRLKRYLRKERGNKIVKFFRKQTKSAPVGPVSFARQARFLVARDRVKTGRILGTGEYGEVYQGEWTDESGSVVAVAIKSLRKESQTRFTSEIQKEIEAMSNVSHPNILRLYGVVLSSPVLLILELAPLGSLEDLLVSEGTKFSVLRLYKYAEKIASGMEYLAEKNIVHRDLASRNILLLTRDKPKISDFGLARPIAPGRKYYEMTNPKGRVAFAWTAPEALKTLRFTVQSDIWSYGVFLWEMFSHGAVPWIQYSPQQIYQMVDAPAMRRLPKPEHCTEDVYGLMHQCWAHDPDYRPSFTEIRRFIIKIWPFKGQAITDLRVENDLGKMSFKAGDIITITEKNSDQFWWFGQNAEGKYGRFPEDLVKLLPDRELEATPPPPTSRENSPGLISDISKPLSVTHNFHVGHNDLGQISEEQLRLAFQRKMVVPPSLSPTIRPKSATPPRNSPPPLPEKRRESNPITLTAASRYHRNGVDGANAAAPPPLPPPKKTGNQPGRSPPLPISRPHIPHVPSSAPDMPNPPVAVLQSQSMPEISAYATLSDVQAHELTNSENVYEPMNAMMMEPRYLYPNQVRPPLPHVTDSSEYVAMSLRSPSSDAEWNLHRHSSIDIPPRRCSSAASDKASSLPKISEPELVIQRVQSAVPNTPMQVAQRILGLYEWREDDAILHLSVVQEAGLDLLHRPERVRSLIAEQGRDPQKAMKELAIERVLEFVREAQIDSKIRKKEARKVLEHCSWGYERAINFITDKKATRKK